MDEEVVEKDSLHTSEFLKQMQRYGVEPVKISEDALSTTTNPTTSNPISNEKLQKDNGFKQKVIKPTPIGYNIPP